MTKTQKLYIDYITEFVKQNGYKPTIQEIADYFDKAVSTIYTTLKKAGVIYALYGNFHPKVEARIKMERVWAMPNKWTFTIKPIKALLNRYVGDGKGWVDPYAGKHSPAEVTNDMDTDMPAEYHLDAKDFVNHLIGFYKGVLFDPPYSYRQITEHYKKAGVKASWLDTSGNYFKRVKDGIYEKITTGGYAISFGWNSNGFGKTRGFKIIEILLVSHGGSHNDTIVTVEQKVEQPKL